MKINWPIHGVHKESNSEFWLLWRGKLVTGWGRPLTGDKKTFNRIMLFGRPFLKTFGRWERLRPGQPTKTQVVSSVFSRLNPAKLKVLAMLGRTAPVRGVTRARITKEQRMMLESVLEALNGIREDVEYLIQEKK